MAHAGGSRAIEIDLSPTSVALSVPCEEVTFGLTEPQFIATLHAAGLVLGGGLVITGVAEGQFGSSIVVFTRLIAVLSTLLAVGPESVDDAGLWATWDEPWRARYGGQRRVTTVNDESDDQALTSKKSRQADCRRPLIDNS
jgi:hypothetical protein